MEAGSKLDMLVAEKVMGGRHLCVVGIHGDGSIMLDWEPSRDIAAAWEVVEKVAATWDVEILRRHAPFNMTHWGCWVGETWSAAATTAPRAICLAALRAVGVDV